MKKLINSLAVITLLGSSTATVMSCKVPVKPDPETNGLTDIQKEMLQGAEFISRLIVGGRHENLNYNINEILSIFLTPSTTAMNMPTSYKYDGKSINMASDINKYKNYLAPSLNYFNGDNYAGMFASYIMGMYDDDFYQTMINSDNKAYYFNDTFSTTGNQGYNKKDGKNAMGYAAGLGSDINLSDNQDRRNLAWAIQDTGALSNYLLNMKFDGANPTDTNGSSGPASSAGEKVGTNGSGYAWYNSILMNDGAKKSTDYSVKDGWLGSKGQELSKNKLKDKNYSKANSDNQSQIGNIKFNSTGGLITKVAGEQNIKGFISLFGSMFENISPTKNGALIFAEFMNVLFPMVRSGNISIGDSNNIMQSVGISLTSNIWKGIKNPSTSDRLDESTKEKINNLDEAPSYSFLGLSSPIVSDLYKSKDKDKINPGTNAANIVDIIDSIVNSYEQSTDKNAFITEMFCTSKKGFYDAYSSMMTYIGEENWKNSMYGKNNAGGIKLLKLVQSFYKMITEENVRNTLDQIIEDFKDEKTFRDLTISKKNELLKDIGWSEKGYEEGSIGARIFSAMTDSKTVGQSDLANFFASFKDYVANAMKEVHEPVLQYLVDEKYWDVNDVKITSTSNTQAGAKMEFNLKYNGIGDVTSNASKQTKQVEVNEKFNPYQTIVENQKDKWKDGLESKLDQEKIANSGKILGLEQGVIKEDELAAYDGKGNYQDYNNVKNSYKIVWENISKNTESPYWIITSIKCFNESGEEFYNIY
ncbi:hypothetical protein [Spiroplasma floricola]|uniref:Lipoprotein n=1 Tax=Spiroplasma floricola 23-6 TaxID=1336749 RepID=A0A2K8SF93_9MOLU|nr:hypothetical protein [Spiroplasma floricola]AUB32101.1 hypothetical protein SFLOR_v1c10550 [Spiroplasma floricola 23-6]